MKLRHHLIIVACCLLTAGGLGCGADGNQGGEQSKGECAHGETRDEDCNTCACDQNEAWVCTEIDCQNVWDGGDAGYADVGDECEPGATKQVDCNTCGCDRGRWVCTEIACADAGDTGDGGGDAS